MQYAILFDRLFRFPVTGSRVRNYDGLGGQLLFAFLHGEGYLHWTDNRLAIDWERIAEGVGALREQGAGALPLGHRPLEARAMDRRARHGRHLRAARAAGSRWAKEGRDLPEVTEPKELVDLVKDDEFPLSLFYVQLQGKLEPVLARPDDAL